MVKVGEGVDTETNPLGAPGIFYHVKLAPGVVFDEGTRQIVEGILTDNKDIILHPDPEGRDKSRIIDVERLLSAEHSKND